MTPPSPDGNASLDEDKAALRAQCARTRAAASSPEAAPEAARALVRHADALTSAFLLRDNMIVAGYWPIRSELDPIPLLGALRARGLKTALPATPDPGAQLVFRLWQSGEDLIEGLFGTSEPLPAAPVCQPDCLLVPMLAFDENLYRLGYGGGFYDRSLAALRSANSGVRAIGIAYAEQRVARIPAGPHDARLDAVLTPDGLIRREGEDA